MEIIISLSIGIILGLALGYYLWRNQTGNNQTELQAEVLAAKNLASEIEKIKGQELARVVGERNVANLRLTEVEKALSTAQEAKASAERSLTQLLELKDEIEKRMREAFASASQSQLTQGRADLLSAAEEKFAPFRSQLDELKKTSAELKGSLTANNESAEKVAKEARKLAEAMTSTTKQGSWGELQLKRVAELTGMLKNIDFVTQETKTTEDGILRPDLVVKLPGERNIIVDAKAPTKNYIEAQNAPNETERTRLLNEFALKIRNHAKQLGAKEYWNQYKPAPEFVILFLPSESLFSVALQIDPSLIEYSWDQKVVIATPTTLLSILRTIAHSWDRVDVEKRAETVIELAEKLYEGIRITSEHFADSSKALNDAVKYHNKTLENLQSKVYGNAEKLITEGERLKNDRKVEPGDVIDIQAITNLEDAKRKRKNSSPDNPTGELPNS